MPSSWLALQGQTSLPPCSGIAVTWLVPRTELQRRYPALHRDGTVSYWSFSRQEWIKHTIFVPVEDLAGMHPYDSESGSRATSARRRGRARRAEEPRSQECI